MIIEKDFFLTEFEILSEIEMSYYEVIQNWWDLKQYIEDNTKVFTQDEQFESILRKFLTKDNYYDNVRE